MEVIVLDNGLISKGEHSYHLEIKLTESLSRRNLRFRVFGTNFMEESIGSEIGAIPHFTRSLYDYPRPDEDVAPRALERYMRRREARRRRVPIDLSTPSELEVARLLNEAFMRDLDALPADVWRADNLVLVPAISQNEIVGLVRSLRAKQRDELPRVVCQLMFPPTWLPWKHFARFGERLYRSAFLSAALIGRRSLFWTVENDAMAALYRRCFGIATTILPIPFGAVTNPAPVSARPRLGFFGYSKTDKGFHLLPSAIERCRRAGLDFEFVVQIHHTGWEPLTIAADRALREMRDVRILEGVLSSETYAAWTGRTDAVLLPYDPAAFGTARGSGIFTESVAGGRPIIASAGTYAGQAIARGEAIGEVFSPYDSDALAAAIGRLLPRLSACKAAAAARAHGFAQKHSPDAYVDALFARAGC